MIVVIVGLFVLGLCLGSFANAVIWRIHEQSKTKKHQKDLSITRGRSMCPDCKHQLSAKDLVPVFSWLFLGGKCRHCHKPISWQYPAVELITAVLFVSSYVFWPTELTSLLTHTIFGLWLAILITFVVLFVYDLRWMILPDKVVVVTMGLALISSVLQLANGDFKAELVTQTLLALMLTAGLFGGLYFISNGRWIGFGDVKLAIGLGLLMATPSQALLMIFLASLLGSLVALPGLLSGKLKKTAQIPFGPFLIVGTIVVYLFGQSLTNWLQVQLILQ